MRKSARAEIFTSGWMLGVMCTEPFALFAPFAALASSVNKSEWDKFCRRDAQTPNQTHYSHLHTHTRTGQPYSIEYTHVDLRPLLLLGATAV